MKSSVKLRFSPWDIIVVAVIAAAAILLGIFLTGHASGTESTGSLICTVNQNGKTLEKVVLAKLPKSGKEFTVGGKYTAVIQMKQDRVRVKSSTCPSKDCVHTGWISRPGQSIICLPNHLTITLSNSKKSTASSGGEGVDIVLGREG